MEYSSNENKTCPNCNKTIKSTWMICPFCKNALTFTQKASSSSIYCQTDNIHDPQKGKGNSTVKVCGCVFFLLIALVSALMLLMDLLLGCSPYSVAQLGHLNSQEQWFLSGSVILYVVYTTVAILSVIGFMNAISGKPYKKVIVANIIVVIMGFVGAFCMGGKILTDRFFLRNSAFFLYSFSSLIVLPAIMLFLQFWLEYQLYPKDSPFDQISKNNRGILVEHLLLKLCFVLFNGKSCFMREFYC